MSMVQELQGSVAAFVRDANRAVPLTEIIDAFPKFPVAQIRLIAQDMRKRGVLTAQLEGKDVFYTWVAKRAPEEPPLRMAGAKVDRVKPPPAPTPAPKAAPAASPSPSLSKGLADRARDKILRAVNDGAETADAIFGVTGVVRCTLRSTIQSMVRAGDIEAAGSTQARRYYPKGKVREPRPEPSPRTPELQPTLPEVEPPMPTPPTEVRRRFCVYNDGSLGIECEKCSGELTREDLEALRQFVNRIPELAHG